MISSRRVPVMQCARLRSVHLSGSRRRGRAGSKVSHLQAPVWALQGDDPGDRSPPDRSDQLGESHRGRWDLVLSRTSTNDETGEKKVQPSSKTTYSHHTITQFQPSVSALKHQNKQLKKRDSFNAAAVFVPLPFFLFHLFRAWHELNVSVCILCLSAGRPERGGLPEDRMCQPHSGHQELLQGTVDKNALKVSKL